MECPACQEECTTVERRRQNTSYVDDARNYVTTCAPCFEQIQIEWAEMWREYHSGCL